MSNILDAKIKQKELVNKSNVNLKLTILATKVGLKAGQVKRRKLQKYHLSHFLGKMGFFGDDALQYNTQYVCLSINI